MLMKLPQQKILKYKIFFELALMVTFQILYIALCVCVCVCAHFQCCT